MNGYHFLLQASQAASTHLGQAVSIQLEVKFPDEMQQIPKKPGFTTKKRQFTTITRIICPGLIFLKSLLIVKNPNLTVGSKAMRKRIAFFFGYPQRRSS